MFALATRPELAFPAIAPGHGSRRHMLRLYEEAAKDNRPVGDLRDCGHESCRVSFDRAGPTVPFDKGHTPGPAKNYHTYQGQEKTAKVKADPKPLVICPMCHDTGRVFDWGHSEYRSCPVGHTKAYWGRK